MKKVKIIGISGCSNSGKTTLSNRLQQELPNAIVIRQDDYYIRNDKHLEYLPELKSYNFDVIDAINMEELYLHLRRLYDSRKYEYIIVEGSLIFLDPKIFYALDKKYFIELSKEESQLRRSTRVYNRPDTPDYFEKCVWPEFLKYKEKCALIKDIIYIDGNQSLDDVFNHVFNDIKGIGDLNKCKLESTDLKTENYSQLKMLKI